MTGLPGRIYENQPTGPWASATHVWYRHRMTVFHHKRRDPHPSVPTHLAVEVVHLVHEEEVLVLGLAHGRRQRLHALHARRILQPADRAASDMTHQHLSS
jgi:hypothetical protein